MKRSVKYVGLDVHQASTVAVVRNENGKIIARGIFATEEEAILSFFRGMCGSVHVAFEEGTQAQWLYDLLKPRVHRVVVCDRRGEKKQGNKGDDPDAERTFDDSPFIVPGRVRQHVEQFTNGSSRQFRNPPKRTTANDATGPVTHAEPAV